MPYVHKVLTFKGLKIMTAKSCRPPEYFCTRQNIPENNKTN